MSSALYERIKKDVVESMKNKNQEKLVTLRLITSALKQKEVDQRITLTDGDVEQSIQKMLKQLQESLVQARQVGRPDAVAELEAQEKTLKEYLPQALSQEEVLALVKSIVEDLKKSGSLPEGPKALGPVMKAAREKIGARSDGNTIQGAVKIALGA